MVAVNRQRVTGEARQQSWRAIVNELFAAREMDFHDGESFAGEVAHARVGELDFAHVVSSGEMGRRTARHIDRDQHDKFVLFTLRSGALRLEQGGRSCDVVPGMLVLYDLNSPSLWHHTAPTDVLNFAIPGFMLRARLRNLGDVVARPCSNQAGSGRIASDLLHSVWGQLEHITEPAACHFARHLVEMVGLAFEEDDSGLPVGGSSSRCALFRRATGYIAAHLTDQDLNPARIASAVGISVRYLHQVFGDAGETVGGFLRNARLQSCYEDLADPSKSRLPIGEIAYRAGFRNPAHFATSFKSRYGVSASERRRRIPAALPIERVSLSESAVGQFAG
jgi:AraC-like DNA-binding protein